MARPYPTPTSQPPQKPFEAHPLQKNFEVKKAFESPSKENLETNTEMGIKSPYFFLPFCLQSKRITCNDFFSNIDNLLDKKILTLWPDPPPTHTPQPVSLHQTISKRKSFRTPLERKFGNKTNVLNSFTANEYK